MKLTFALIYDFDGTLCPGSMQDGTIIPKTGLTSDAFWQTVEAERDRVQGDATLTYMRVLLDLVRSAGYDMTWENLIRLGAGITLFKGVEGFFERVNALVREFCPAAEVRHYIVSSGLKELILGCPIAAKFDNIFACEYHYGEDGRADFPKFCINSTDKTQYIFRINKGLEGQERGLHAYMEPELRPVPLSNMIYIGDGMTDIPCMKIIRQHGGSAFSVYNPLDAVSTAIRDKLIVDNRVDGSYEADYSADSGIESAVLDAVKSKIIASYPGGFACPENLEAYKI